MKKTDRRPRLTDKEGRDRGKYLSEMSAKEVGERVKADPSRWRFLCALCNKWHGAHEIGQRH